MNFRMNARCLLTVTIAFVAMLLLSTDLMACPTCKNGMSGGDPVSVARASGYFYSILFMMSMPFLIVGTFGGAAYLSIKRAREREQLTRE
jgi:p-aminobenzoyl-glutamate transporter AbgT